MQPDIGSNCFLRCLRFAYFSKNYQMNKSDIIGPVRHRGLEVYINSSGNFAIETKYHMLGLLSEGLISFKKCT
jgi:hypothetical protein